MQTRQLKAAGAAASATTCYRHIISIHQCSRHRSAVCPAASSDVQPQSHTSHTLPDVSLDDLLSGIPSPVPADMLASQPAGKRKQHKETTRIGDSITTREKAGATPGARQKVAQLLRKAKQRKSEGTTSTPQQETPSSLTVHVEYTQPTVQEPQNLTPQAASSQATVEEPGAKSSSVIQPETSSGIVPGMGSNDSYGPLETRRKRRSRLFNLNNDISLPSIAAAVLQPEVVTPATRPHRSTASSRTDTQQSLSSQITAGMNLQPPSQQPTIQSQDTFVQSTKQNRRARLRGNQRHRSPHVTDSEEIVSEQNSSPSSVHMQQSTSRQRARPTQIQPNMGMTRPSRTEGQFPVLPHQPRNQPAGIPQLSTTSFPVTAGLPSRPQAPVQRPHSTFQRQAAVSNTVGITAITFSNWRWIAADGWPNVYTPSYHTSLYEFLLDVWLEAGKDLARGSSSTAQAAFKLFKHCQESQELLLVQTSLIAFCDGLADSEELQDAAIITLPYQGLGDLLHKLVLPLIQVLYPGELARPDGCFTALYDAVKRQAIATVNTTALLATDQQEQYSSTAEQHLLLLPPDWQTLLQQLLKFQPIHPGVALGPLITLFELDSSDQYTG